MSASPTDSSTDPQTRYRPTAARSPSKNIPDPQRGLLVLGHGTRDPEGMHEFRQTVALVARRCPTTAVRGAFLELSQPTLDAGLRELADEGARAVVIVPLLLLAAGHVRRDIPAAIRDAAGRAGFGQLVQALHLGCHPQLVELSAERCREAQAAADLPPGDRLVLLVGRGNRDARAWSEMRDFALARQQIDTGTPLRLAYLAMTRPSFDEVAREILHLPIRQVIVQPHLLFRGELFRDLAQRVRRMAAQRADQRWVLAEPLGPAPRLAAVVEQRFRQAAK